MRNITTVLCAALSLMGVLRGASAAEDFDARRYLQCRSGEIQLLPALGSPLMRDVYEGRAPFDIPLPDELRAKCRRAFDRHGHACEERIRNDDARICADVRHSHRRGNGSVP